MALFQKRPQVGEVMSYYTTSLSKTVLFVGLGNPGKKYDGTRHNIGFSCVDYFVDKNDEPGEWTEKKDLKCLLATGQMGQTRVIVIKPTTFMNLSGEAVRAVMAYYKVPLEQVIIIHDELDIDFGHIRTRIGGTSAGHNGVKSVSELVSENTGRIRIGIGPKHPAQIDSADFVLEKFSAKEAEQLPNLMREVTAVLTEFLYSNNPLLAETRNFLI